MDILGDRYLIDELAAQVGGYFSPPTEEDIAFTNLLFEISERFGIHYYSATKKERFFVEEVTRVTWARHQEEKNRYPSGYYLKKTEKGEG